MAVDHYQVLGVTPDATDEEIRRAYLAAARQHHPDFHAGDLATQRAAESRMREINRAWEVLSDRARRTDHDMQRLRSDAASGPPRPATGRAEWRPYDPSPDPGFDPRDDRPISAGGVPSWLRTAPMAAAAGGTGAVVMGAVLDLRGVVGAGVFALSASVMLLVVAALVALTSSRR